MGDGRWEMGDGRWGMGDGGCWCGASLDLTSDLERPLYEQSTGIGTLGAYFHDILYTLGYRFPPGKEGEVPEKEVGGHGSIGSRTPKG
jgi:hypothetical protein